MSKTDHQHVLKLVCAHCTVSRGTWNLRECNLSHLHIWNLSSGQRPFLLHWLWGNLLWSAQIETFKSYKPKLREKCSKFWEIEVLKILVISLSQWQSNNHDKGLDWYWSCEFLEQELDIIMPTGPATSLGT